MTFIEAIQTGKLIRSEHWEKDQYIDSSIFTSTYSDVVISVISEHSKPLLWRDILSKWYILD